MVMGRSREGPLSVVPLPLSLGLNCGDGVLLEKASPVLLFFLFSVEAEDQGWHALSLSSGFSIISSGSSFSLRPRMWDGMYSLSSGFLLVLLVLPFSLGGVNVGFFLFRGADVVMRCSLTGSLDQSWFCLLLRGECVMACS